jgi:hypothetical protein
LHQSTFLSWIWICSIFENVRIVACELSHEMSMQKIATWCKGRKCIIHSFIHSESESESIIIPSTPNTASILDPTTWHGQNTGSSGESMTWISFP